jgi:hypothetical protein
MSAEYLEGTCPKLASSQGVAQKVGSIHPPLAEFSLEPSPGGGMRHQRFLLALLLIALAVSTGAFFLSGIWEDIAIWTVTLFCVIGLVILAPWKGGQSGSS